MDAHTDQTLWHGALVVVIMHSPREKYWGILDGINQSGVYLRGTDLSGFDDLIRSFASDGDEPFSGLTEAFFPMWRVERIARDRRAGDVPALFELFEQRTGKRIEHIFANDEQPESISQNPF